MKHYFTKKLTVILLLCACAASASFAQSVCNSVYTANFTNAALAEEAKFKLSFNTRTSDGAVLITISPYSSLTPFAYFRSDDWCDNITVLENDVPKGASTTFFSISLSLDRTCIILTPKSTFETLVAGGGTIKLTFANKIEYSTAWINGSYINCNLNNLVSPNPTNISYIYGTNCGTELATPTGLSVDNSRIVTFTEVTGATGYRVIVRRNDYNDIIMFAQNVTNSGEVLKMTIPSESSKTYYVRVTAFDDNGSFSAPSEQYTWTYTNNAAVQSAATSAYCEAFYNPEPNTDPFFNNASNSSENDAFLITWETAKVNFAGDATHNPYNTGDFVITLSNYGDRPAVFSGDGFYLNNIIIGGLPGNVVLTKVTGNDNCKNRVFRVRTDIGLSAIPEGVEITYFGKMTVKVNETDVSGNYVFDIPYRYGSDCASGQLATPVISSISENILTFSPVDTHADNFVVKIYEQNSQNIVHQQNVSGSGQTITFTTVGQYDVTVTAVGSAPFEDSNESAIYQWNILPYLETPTITNIDDDGVVTFAPADVNAVSFLVSLYQNNGTTLINTFSINNSGETLPLPMSGNYKVSIKAIGDNISYQNSGVSALYSWTVTSALGNSNWCKRYVNSGNQEDDKDAALFSIETGENGELIITIEGVNGHNATFRNNGIYGALQGSTALNSFSVGTKNANNGSNFFEKDYTFNNIVDKQVFTLKEGVTIPSGTPIWYDGKIEVASSLPNEVTSYSAVTDIIPVDNNVYARFRFDNYIYGTNCALAPKISVDKKNLIFSPTMPQGTNIINVTGENLTDAVNVVVPPGYVAEPNVLTPDGNGEVNQQIAVYWDGGFYHYRNVNYKGVGLLTFNGGGVNSLHNAPRVAVFGYQMGCTYYNNYCLGDGGSANKPAYLSMSLNSYSTILYLDISPTEPTGEAVWQSDVMNGGNVKVNGNPTAVTQGLINDNKTIKLTFPSRLNLGDVLSFRDCSPQQNLKWTISDYPQQWNNDIGSETTIVNPFGNGSITLTNWNNLGTGNGLATFTVGDVCQNNAAPIVRNADISSYEIPPSDIEKIAITETEMSAKVYLDIVRGTNPVASVIFTNINTETTSSFSSVSFPFAANGQYEITGLELNKTYNIYVKIIDVKGNHYGYGVSGEFGEPLAYIQLTISEADITTGTAEMEQKKFVIYPNPVTSELTISLIATGIELTENDVIEIFDISGRVVAMHALTLRESITINVSALSQGIYFLKIGDNTEKFIKK